MNSVTSLDIEKNDPSKNETAASVSLTIAPLPSTIIPEFPEGGFRGWCTVLGAWLVQFVIFGYINGFGAYQTFYVQTYLDQSTPSEIGWIGGIQICLTFSSGIFTGRLFDMGYFYLLQASSLLLYAISLFMLSLSKQNHYYQVLLTHGVGFGLASGLTFVPSLSIVGHYFKRRRPIAIGIVATGAALGGIVQPMLLNHLFNGKIGFHNGVRISAGVNIFLLIVANCLIRTRLPPRRDGPLLPLKRFLSDIPYLSAVIGSICTYLGLFFAVFYLQLYAATHKIDGHLVSYSISMLNGVSILGRIISSLLAPKFGPLNLMVFFTAATGVISMCMSAVTSNTGLVVFGACYGFVSGGVISLTPAMMVSLIDDPNEYGARLGVYFCAGGFVGLVATPISGALLTSSYHWAPASLFAGALVISAALLHLVSRVLIARRRHIRIL